MSGGLTWSSRAEGDIVAIAAAIGEHQPSAGRRFIRKVIDDAEFLAIFPNAGALREGHARSLPGLRSWPVSGFRSYLILYVPLQDEEGIEIVRVLPAARDVDRAVHE